MSTRKVVTLKFTGTDLSANCRTGWVEKPDWARYIAVGIGWSATGAPVGTLYWETASTDSATVGAATAFPVGPAGTANQVYHDLIETAGPFIAVSYVVGSGGTGAAWTDDTGVAATLPVVIFTR